jgi:sirohydrochlorin ferrochelatase
MNAPAADPTAVAATSTAVLLIAHGSRRPAANQDLFDLAGRLAAGGPHAIVQASFLELAEPDILDGGGRCVAQGAARVLMVPYFLAAGVHLRRDLTAARDELAARHPGVQFVLGPALGPHALLDRLVAERVRETDRAADDPDAGAADPAVEVDEVWSRG